MTVSVKHTFVSSKGDSTDTSLVRPSNWNAAHTMNMSGIALLGRGSSDTGSVQEIPLGPGLSITGGILTATVASLPIGTVVDFAGTSAPSKWLMCYGQAVSRVTYSALFVVISTNYGIGDGSTTFNLPDLRGRVRAGKDNMGGTSSNRLTTPINGDTLGAVGGSQSHVLITSELPVHTHTGTTIAAGSHRHFVANTDASTTGSPAIAAGDRLVQSNDTSGNNSYKLDGTTRDPTVAETSSSGNHSHTFTTDATGANGAVTLVQPTLIINSIIYTGV